MAPNIRRILQNGSFKGCMDRQRRKNRISLIRYFVFCYIPETPEAYYLKISPAFLFLWQSLLISLPELSLQNALFIRRRAYQELRDCPAV